MMDSMDSIQEMHARMLQDFKKSRELVSVNYSCAFKNCEDAKNESSSFYESVKNNVLIARKKIEKHFYNMHRHQMFSRLQEIKFYSDVSIYSTRRLISVSPDCISAIHVMVRDEVHVNVYFRSSDIDGALPGDLEFLAGLGAEFIEHLEQSKGTPGYAEVTPEGISVLRNKPMHLNLSFGSLHRTN